MIITWQGQSCFKIQDKVGSEGITLVTDPFDKSLGLKVPNFEADIVTVSHDHYDHNNVAAFRGTPKVIKSAGEYDIKGVMIEGVLSYHDASQGKERGNNIIYRIEMDDITICHLGDLGHVLDNKQLERLEGIDILLVPVGGKYTLDAKLAVEVISQIEPRIVIPMHYNRKGLDQNIYKELAGVEDFISQIGEKDVQPEDKLTITKSQMPEETQMVVLNG